MDETAVLVLLGFGLLFAFFLFLFVAASREEDLPDVAYVFDFTRHEWWRELKSDWRTSRKQLRTDWQRLTLFASGNTPWLAAVGVGLFGLTLTSVLLFLNLPQGLRDRLGSKTARAAASANDSIDTSADGDIGHPADDSVFLQASGEYYSLAPRSSDVESGRTLSAISSEQFDPLSPLDHPTGVGAAQFDPPADDPVTADPPIFDPSLDTGAASPDPGLLASDPDGGELDEKERLRRAFEEFEFIPERDPEPSLEPGLSLEFVRSADEPALDDDEEFVVTSSPVFQPAEPDEPFADLNDSTWTRRAPGPAVVPEPSLYEDREGVRLSQHEEEMASDDIVRIRPRAVGREASPHLEVVKRMPETVVAGAEFSYEILIHNPGPDAVGGLLVEEQTPVDWSIIDVHPPARVVDSQMLRWTAGDLPGGETLRLTVTARPGGNVVGDAVTLITTGSAVETIVDIGGSDEADLFLPDPAELLPEQVEPAAFEERPHHRPLESEWRSRDRRESQKPIAGPRLDLRVRLPARATMGTRPTFEFVVTNAGAISVSDARVMLWLARQFRHPRGERISHRVPPLAPGESRTIRLSVDAREIGTAACRVELRAGSAVQDRQTFELAVVR